MNIQLKEGNKPVISKPYHASKDDRIAIEQHIQKWREHGIVKDTTSPYASPVILATQEW